MFDPVDEFMKFTTLVFTTLSTIIGCTAHYDSSTKREIDAGIFCNMSAGKCIHGRMNLDPTTMMIMENVFVYLTVFTFIFMILSIVADDVVNNPAGVRVPIATYYVFSFVLLASGCLMIAAAVKVDDFDREKLDDILRSNITKKLSLRLQTISKRMEQDIRPRRLYKQKLVAGALAVLSSFLAGFTAWLHLDRPEWVQACFVLCQRTFSKNNPTTEVVLMSPRENLYDDNMSVVEVPMEIPPPMEGPPVPTSSPPTRPHQPQLQKPTK